MLLFLWKFISLFGSDGPRFFEFEMGHSCGEALIFHLLMLNNLLPWASRDYCIEPSWYLANDIQFMVTCVWLVAFYRTSKKKHAILMLSVLMLALIIQIV